MEKRYRNKIIIIIIIIEQQRSVAQSKSLFMSQAETSSRKLGGDTAVYFMR